MSGSLNLAQLIGHLGRDPESRRTNAGDPVVSFSIATSERWTDKATGEKKERTEWHQVVIFNPGLAEVAERFLRKGSLVYIAGRLQTRKWQHQDGSDRYSTEVVLQRFGGELKLLDKADRPAREPDSYGTTRSRMNADDPRTRPQPNDLDDDIPF